MKGDLIGCRGYKNQIVITMQYALLIYENESIFGPGNARPKLQDVVGRHVQFAQELGARRFMTKQVPLLEDGTIEMRPVLGLG